MNFKVKTDYKEDKNFIEMNLTMKMNKKGKKWVTRTGFEPASFA